VQAILFCSTKCPDGLCRRTNPLFRRYWRLFSRVKRRVATPFF